MSEKETEEKQIEEQNEQEEEQEIAQRGCCHQNCELPVRRNTHNNYGMYLVNEQSIKSGENIVFFPYIAGENRSILKNFPERFLLKAGHVYEINYYIRANNTIKGCFSVMPQLNGVDFNFGCAEGFFSAEHSELTINSGFLVNAYTDDIVLTLEFRGMAAEINGNIIIKAIE